MSTMTLPSALDQLDFIVSEEQQQLRDLVRRFLDDHYPMPRIRHLMTTPTGHDAGLWQRMAEETGLTGLLIPEEFGGSGLGIADAQIVAEEMGRTLFNGPFLSSAIISVLTLLECGDQTIQKRILPVIADGSRILTVAGLEYGSNPAKAINDGNTVQLTGEFNTIPDGHIADHLIVPASAEDKTNLYLIAGNAPGLKTSSPPMFDQTRRFAEITLTETPAIQIGSPCDGDRILERVRDRVLTILAAETSGAAQACMDMAVAYAKERYQFGRPIGSFQAIKHKCADMLLLIEEARSATAYAGACAGEAIEELPIATAMAKARCTEAFAKIADETLQIHGGMGFTWDHDCHLFLKRAKSSEIFLGSPVSHRQRLAGMLEI